MIRFYKYITSAQIKQYSPFALFSYFDDSVFTYSKKKSSKSAVKTFKFICVCRFFLLIYRHKKGK